MVQSIQEGFFKEEFLVIEAVHLEARDKPKAAVKQENSTPKNWDENPMTSKLNGNQLNKKGRRKNTLQKRGGSSIESICS